MTKKDFIKFAEVIKELRTFDIDAAKYAFEQFCNICRNDNQYFDYYRFQEACGLTDAQLSTRANIASRRVTRKFFIAAPVPCPPSSHTRTMG